jgi:hypothetical protein
MRVIAELYLLEECKAVRAMAVLLLILEAVTISLSN